ncbi:hypothetical protein AOX59_03045 [Lentibacillus amyloliquefaciens]|uniref:Uncharacterized protein n=1 Tax=Lentibacillus amyloliquefaciens TaxID=1472767 RepID=A0A0U4FIT6_9BACI|nr:hypothetical protein AOX59_03045 [Lentibacillus amyloliquefaciens]
MFLKRFNRTGKVIAFTGMWISAFGFAFNETIAGVSGTPDSLAALSIPLIAIGIILLITSNFFKRKREG